MKTLTLNEVKEIGFYWVKYGDTQRIVEVKMMKHFKNGKFTHEEPIVGPNRIWIFGKDSQWVGPLESPFNN